MTPNDVVNVTSSTAAESGGEFLWLWYVVFTVVLLGLILTSFVRFHCKRLQQQKLRLDAEMTYTVKRRHMTPSPSYSNHVISPAAVVNLDTQSLLTSHSNDVRGHAGDLQRSRGREDGYMKRAPVVYMFNANGSMVDVRCTQLEVCNTFRFDNDYNPDDQQRIYIQSGDDDVDESHRPRSCLKCSYDPLTSTSLSHAVEGDLPQSNHHPHSSQLHLLTHHHHQQQQQHQYHHQRRPSPTHHRYRHRHTSSAAARTSLLHPSRIGREYLASSDEELSRSAAAAEALMLWQKR